MTSKKAEEKLRKIKKVLSKMPEDDYDFLIKKIIEQIRKRTKAGKGLSSSGKDLEKLKALSDSYKELRKKKRSKLGDKATPGKSNLTASGKMLDSMKGRKKKGPSLEFELKGTTKGLGSKSVSTDKVASYQEDQGRKFFGLSESEERGIQREIRKILEKIIKEEFNKV